jgi:hypothetical protein
MNKGNKILKLTKVETLDSGPNDSGQEARIGNWTRLEYVDADGDTGPIPNADMVIPTSLEELRTLLQQAEELSKNKSSTKPNGRHPDSFAP